MVDPVSEVDHVAKVDHRCYAANPLPRYLVTYLYVTRKNKDPKFHLESMVRHHKLHGVMIN
jgi:hypothetical protein